MQHATLHDAVLHSSAVSRYDIPINQSSSVARSVGPKGQLSLRLHPADVELFVNSYTRICGLRFCHSRSIVVHRPRLYLTAVSCRPGHLPTPSIYPTRAGHGEEDTRPPMPLHPTRMSWRWWRLNGRHAPLMQLPMYSRSSARFKPFFDTPPLVLQGCMRMVVPGNRAYTALPHRTPAVGRVF